MMSNDNKRAATDSDYEALANLIADYVQENNIIPATLSEPKLGQAVRTVEYRRKQDAIASKRAIVDKTMLLKGFLPLDEAAQSIGMKWEQLSLLIKSYKLKPIYLSLDGQEITRSQANRGSTYIDTKDIADKDAIQEQYEALALVSTARAAEMMGVTSSTFSKWAKRASITPHDTKRTNQGYNVHLWTIAQVNQVIEFRNDSK